MADQATPVFDQAFVAPAQIAHAPRRAPTIGHALVILVLACVLPIALAAAGLMYHVYSTERAGLVANALNRTRAIAAALDREVLSMTGPAAMLRAQKLPSSWRAAIIGTDGLVLARSHEPGQFVGKPATPDLLKRMREQHEGAYESVSLDGIAVVIVYSLAPRSGWTMAVGIPLAELTAGMHRSIAWLALCAVAAVGAGLLMASLIARRIAGSMTALIAPAAAIGGNGPLPLPALHFDEARILAAALVGAHDKLASMAAGLRASEQRLELAIQATGIGIWVRDLAHQHIWASGQWRVLFGFSADEVIGLDQILARIHSDDRAAVRATLLGIASQGGAYDIEYRLALPDGARRWIASRGRIGSDGADAGAVVLGISSDVSARKLAELALQKKQEEVFHLSRVSVLGELSGALAHEINQPLTAILSNAQAAQRLIERTPPPLAAIGDILADIVAEDRHAAEVIRRLRGLLRKSEIVREVVDVRVIAAEVASLLRNDLLNRAISLVIAIPADLPSIEADPVQLQQILINLVVNACDAIGARGGTRSIVVAATYDGRWIDLSVHDSGPGLLAAGANADAMFEPFYSSKTDGLGLGLSICRRIATAHGGRVWAENSPAGGAMFHVNLPVRHD